VLEQSAYAPVDEVIASWRERMPSLTTICGNHW